MTRLRHISAINPATLAFDLLPSDAQLPFVPLEAVWPEGLDLSRVKPKSEVATGYTRFQEGDIVVPKITPTFQADRSTIARGIDGYVAAGTTELHVVRVHEGFDTRYVRYLLSSREFLDGGEAEMIGVAGQKRVPDEWLRDFRVPLTDLTRQRAIADYLDAETARIDALIAKKQRLVEVVVERGNLALERAMTRRGVPWPISLEELEAATAVGECRVIHLSQCLDQLTNGYVGPTRDILVDDGIRYVQSLHVKGGRIDFDRRPFFVTPEWHAERPRIHLRENDVLIVQTGDIGQVAVVPPGFGEASCHALQIARVRPSVVLGPFLAEYLRSDLGYQSLLSRATGALHPHLEGGIRTVPVVVPSLQVQREVIEEVAAARRYAVDVSARLARQIDLLREHRQALITAAVTGAFEVPGVAA